MSEAEYAAAESQANADVSGERGEDEFPIVVEGLRNSFGDHVIHEDLSLKVRRGEILGVVGGSGTGKSVLMRSIIGLQHPAAGSIDVLGQPMTGNPASPDEIEPVAPPAPDGDARVTLSPLLLRSGPSPDAEPILVMPEGATVTLTGEGAQDGYVTVDYDGQPGWAYADLLGEPGAS